MRLQVLISTYGRAGIDRTAALRLPEVKEAGYLVGWQRGGDNGPVPQALIRPDMIVVESDTRGLAANRNMLLIRRQSRRRHTPQPLQIFRRRQTVSPTFISIAGCTKRLLACVDRDQHKKRQGTAAFRYPLRIEFGPLYLRGR